MVKISGQTEVGCTLTRGEKVGHAQPSWRVYCTRHPLEKPNSTSFWYFGHNFLVLTLIQPPFEPTDFPFIPLQDCKIKSDLSPDFDSVWNTLRQRHELSDKPRFLFDFLPRFWQNLPSIFVAFSLSKISFFSLLKNVQMKATKALYL